MNERIKELILASGFSTDFIEDAQLKATQQKFAELLIKECQQVLYKNQTSSVQSYNWGRQVASNDIAEWFGFEKLEAPFH